jgi:hypothetical protein
MTPERNDLDVAYAEAAEIARYFWDWRYKLLTYSLTLNVALFAAFGWAYVRDNARWISALPLLGGALTSTLLAVMDYRNSRLLDMAYAVAAPIERRWFRDSHRTDGRPITGFYESIQGDVGTHRTWHGAWHSRNSSYTVILRWWFSLAATAYVAALVVDLIRVL